MIHKRWLSLLLALLLLWTFTAAAEETEPDVVTVAQQFPVNRFILTFPEDATFIMQRAIRSLKALSIVPEHMGDGDAFTLGGATLTVIQRDGWEFTENDRSAMLLVQYGDRRLLLAGDVENRSRNSYVETPPAVGSMRIS